MFDSTNTIHEVGWERFDAEMRQDEAAYRANKEVIDNQDRLAIKRDLLCRHEENGFIYQDSGNQLHIGYERNGQVYIFAFLNLDAGFIHFVGLAKANRTLVQWAPISQINWRTFKLIAPKGSV